MIGMKPKDKSWQDYKPEFPCWRDRNSDGDKSKCEHAKNI
jgi:hypothetical protein